MEASCYRGDMSDRVFSRIARKSYEAFYSLDNCRHCDLKKDTDKTARKTSFSMRKRSIEKTNEQTIVRAVQVGTRHSKLGEHGF